tara:strand:+ start:198 stop:1295 length:1098 start_codon:yes stop_codon:yes gene_type:complete
MGNKYTGLDKRFLERTQKQREERLGSSNAGQLTSQFANIDARNESEFKQILDNLSKGTVLPPNSGIAQTEPVQPRINFVVGPSEKNISSKDGNASIVLGYDRPSTLASGQGGVGTAGSNTIDIVAGRMSCMKKQKSDGKLNAGVNPSFVCDAARIYVSQLTEVDLNFGLAPGIIGGMNSNDKKLEPASAIALKADGVRVIGREGIKIVTGKTYAFSGTGFGGEINSRGGKIQQPAPPIELIAGNNTDQKIVFGGLYNPREKVNQLQGVAKGEFTADALREVAKLVELLTGCVDRLTLIQTAMNSTVGITYLEPWRAGASGTTVSSTMAWIESALWQLRIQNKLYNINYTSPVGYKYVASRNVYST